MFDPTIGRWISEDPSGIQPDEDRYRYCHNDPLNFTDPGGLNEQEAKERKGQQLLFGVPTDKDAPLDTKIYSAKDAPVGLYFADESFWKAIRGQMSGKSIFTLLDKRQNIERENA